jgi:Tfp pilus assembly protein PilX
MKHSIQTPIVIGLAAQRGVVLALVLVLLGILSLVGALTMRNATLTEQTTNSLRTAAVAQQAAELALKYCEQVARSTALTDDFTYTAGRTRILATTITTAISAGAWTLPATWSTAANIISVTGTFALSGDSAATKFKNPPQCVIQPIKNSAGTGFVITARGFGNDAVINANNGVTSGAEAWAQSVLQ